MSSHPTLLLWHKCPICGFCELDPERVSLEHKDKIINNPMCPTLGESIARGPKSKTEYKD